MEVEKEMPDIMENSDALPEDVEKKLSEIIEKYNLLSDEEKEEFQNGAFEVLTKSLKKSFADMILPTWLAPYQSYMLFTFAISLVVFFLGTKFFAFLDNIQIYH